MKNNYVHVDYSEARSLCCNAPFTACCTDMDTTACREECSCCGGDGKKENKRCDKDHNEISRNACDCFCWCNQSKYIVGTLLTTNCEHCRDLVEKPKKIPRCKPCKGHANPETLCNHCPEMTATISEVSKPRTKEKIMKELSYGDRLLSYEINQLIREYALSCLPKEVAVDPDNEYFLRGYNAAIEEMRRRILM